MPHLRERLALSPLLKKTKFFPITAIQGARQTGKSFLARVLFAQLSPNAKYVSFDDEAIKSIAIESSKAFLSEFDDFKPLIIDEAQKVPSLFDALKFNVDHKKIPGKFILLGSTEFSKETLIREPLTGRMGRIMIFPLTIQESIGLKENHPILQKDVIKALIQGGLPGICFVRESENRDALFQDWLNLTCFRDLTLFKKLKLEGELALRILKQLAILNEPTQAEVSKALKINPKKIETHLKVLMQLFVIHKIWPHPSGTGKPMYLLFDSGIAHFLGASRERCLHITFLNELLVENEYSPNKKSDFFYYRSTGKKHIHIIKVTHDQKIHAFQVITHDKIKKTDSELMKSFLLKNPKSQGKVLAPISESIKVNQIQYTPWETFISD